MTNKEEALNHFSETIPASKAKTYFSQLLRRMREHHESFAITKRGKIEGVLLSIEEYESLIETLDILSDKEMMRSIERGLKDEKAGRVFPSKKIFKD